MYLARNSETPVNLTPEFYGACDPDISFDAQMIVFSGKKTVQNHWQLWKMSLNGSAKKQISGIESDCFMPVYAGNRFYLNDPQPTPQIIFVSAAQAWKESPVFSLYGMDPTGETIHRLTFNLFNDTEPDILPDGRIVYSSWQPAWQDNQLSGKYAFMAINNDGTDGLSRFKRGWSTGTRTAYFCGRIFDHARYSEIMSVEGGGTTDYFPAYRKGELG